MNDIDYFSKASELLGSQTPFVSIILVDANGSVPQNVGAKMLVTSEGRVAGTVGGGKVEMKAIDEALGLLNPAGKQTAQSASDCAGDSANCGNGIVDRSSGKRTQFATWSLTRDVGMTCGGSVKLYFETYNTAMWNITVFGAGHISQALVELLLKLECRVTAIDPREEWLYKLPEHAKLTRILEPDMPSRIASLPEQTFVVLMTMGHSSDKPILLEILKQGRKFPYLGIIGSEAKAARLRKDIEEAGLPDHLKNSFYCPMGLDIGTNHPQEIAFSIIAQLLQQRDVASR